MSSVTIYRGLSTKGEEIAARVAQRLGYAYISHERLLTDASAHFSLPLIKLTGAPNGATSFLNLPSYTNEEYLACVECALLEHARIDNIVYDGPMGNFLKGIKHVLNVCTLPRIEDRVRSVYDLALDLHNTTVADAVETICHMVESDRFKATPESQRAMDDLVLAAHVKTKLVTVARNMFVNAHEGRIRVDVGASLVQRDRLVDEFKSLSEEIRGVVDISVNIIPIDMEM